MAIVDNPNYTNEEVDAWYSRYLEVVPENVDRYFLRILPDAEDLIQSISLSDRTLIAYTGTTRDTWDEHITDDTFSKGSGLFFSTDSEEAAGYAFTKSELSGSEEPYLLELGIPLDHLVVDTIEGQPEPEKAYADIDAEGIPSYDGLMAIEYPADWLKTGYRFNDETEEWRSDRRFSQPRN
jgi:hypothetical protein